MFPCFFCFLAAAACGLALALTQARHWEQLAQGAAEILSEIQKRQLRKTKRENDVHLRQLAKKNTYVRSFFSDLSSTLFGVWRFSARGVRKHGKKIEY
jgi:hypothetical protein